MAEGLWPPFFFKMEAADGAHPDQPMPRHTLTYYFDVVSPYNAFAFATLMRYRARWGLEIDAVPIFLGGVMQATGNRPPALTGAEKAQ